MNRPTKLILATMILFCAAPTLGYGQAAPPSPPGNTAPVTGMRPDRTTADRPARQKMQQRQSVLRQKRAECRKQASEQKIPLLKRRRFIRDCINR